MANFIKPYPDKPRELLTPGEINDSFDEPVYKCRCCYGSKNLTWFRGTSCPVCDAKECIDFCEKEWQEAYEQEFDD
jgi:hypothetical protein